MLKPNAIAQRIHDGFEYPAQMMYMSDAKSMVVLTAFRHELNEVILAEPGVSMSGASYELTVYCQTREGTLAALKALGQPGVLWSRNDEGNGKLSYSRPADFSEFGMHEDASIRISGQPPASCKTVETEEVVPSFTRKVKKIVCDNGDDVEVAKPEGGSSSSDDTNITSENPITI